MVFIGKIIRLDGEEVGTIQPLSFYLKGSEKLNKKIKRIVPFILVAVLASSFVMANYNKAREVKAIVGVDDLAIAGLVTTLLLAYGYATTQYYNNTDGANALADEWEEEYNQARLTVINGGGGSDNGDDDDDKNKFEDTDGDGKITEKDIPPFSNFLTKNAVMLSANASLLLAPIITSYIQNQFGSEKATNVQNIKSLNNAIGTYCSDNNIDLSNYRYYSISQYGSVITKIYSNNAYSIEHPTYYSINGDGVSFLYTVSDGKIWQFLKSAFGSIKKNDSSTKFWVSNIPIYSSIDDYNSNKRIDWVTPELQDTFDNKGNLELLPSFDPLASYSMASQQALQELLSNLASSSLSSAQQFDLVNKFIASLKTSETPDPSPNPDPSPEPNPDPDPSNPDNGSDGDSSGDSDIDKGSFVRDLKNLFPFCIPFDLIDCIRLFNAEPVTPKVELPIHFPIVNVDYTFTIDLKDFDGVAKICRSMFMILFIIGLVLATRPLIRG